MNVQSLPVVGQSARRPAVSGGAASRVSRAKAGKASASETSARKVDPKANYDRGCTSFGLKSTAANLLKPHDEKRAVRLGQCGYATWSPIVRAVYNKTKGTAHYSGLTTCANVWCCPVCSPRIAAKRKAELDALLSGSRAAGYSVVMLTLTARHNKRTELAPFLDAMKGALKRLRQRKEWRRLPLVGSVTASEVTFGRNGGHAHFHILIVLESGADQAEAIIEKLRPVWDVCLASQGLTGNHAAFHVQNASQAGEYVAKFGAAEEMALQGNKKGRKDSRTPWQLLEDARAGDKQAAAQWVEFAQAYRGRRQLVWSNGLKARFGIGEVSDDEAAAAEEDAPADDVVIVREWASRTEWRAVRSRRCAILYAIESGGSIDAAETGLRDREACELLLSGPVLEDCE